MIPREYDAIRGRNRLIPDRYHMKPREYHAIYGRNCMIPDKYHMILYKYHLKRLRFAPTPAKITHSQICGYAVVGESRILVSTHSHGAYSFDTASAAWSKAGDWSLPFRGRAEYVPEHGLWFGLSAGSARGTCPPPPSRTSAAASCASPRCSGSFAAGRAATLAASASTTR
uniref:Uncharacterized protein n=1 Tax=Oryza barthii TaxID=65489 RepID=A0A0D3F0L2_9ORYZ